MTSATIFAIADLPQSGLSVTSTDTNHEPAPRSMTRESGRGRGPPRSDISFSYLCYNLWIPTESKSPLNMGDLTLRNNIFLEQIDVLAKLLGREVFHRKEILLCLSTCICTPVLKSRAHQCAGHQSLPAPLNPKCISTHLNRNIHLSSLFYSFPKECFMLREQGYVQTACGELCISRVTIF